MYSWHYLISRLFLSILQVQQISNNHSRYHKMISYIKTNSDNTGFLQLVVKLDAELKIRDGEDHAFYAQLNKTDSIRHVVVAYDNGTPIGCGAMRPYSDDTMEVKRMYVLQNWRGEGIASEILRKLERWAIDLNYKKCLLETGKNQPEAIAFYKKNNYRVVPNFGHYENVQKSICFEKILSVD